MKKRVWSLLLALALCLSLLPTAALAEELQLSINSDGTSTEDVHTVDGDTAAPEDGIAPLADGANVASVTINGETTEYSNIFRAFESVEKVSSATIKLLDNVYLPEDEDERFKGFPGKIEFRSSGSVTLDLNGHMLTQADIGFTDGYTPNVIEMLYGTLTITGKGTIYQRYKTSAVSVSSQSALTIDSNDVTVKADFAYGSKQFPTDSSRAIAVNGGALEIRGGTFTATSGVALEYTEGTVRLFGGTFNGIKIVTYKYPGKINEGVTIVDLLAPGYTYQHTDGTSSENFYVQNISDVKVVNGLTPVPYVDENGEAATVTDYIQIEPNTTTWNGGTYVVKGNVTIDGDVTVTGAMPSIILCDRASLTVNGGIALPKGLPDPLTIYGQTGGTGTMTVTNKNGAAFSCEEMNVAMIRLLNGTLTATGKDTAFSNVIVWNQTGYGNDKVKCIETGGESETWADGQAVPSVTLSRCTEHQWSYAQHASAEQHMRTCALCLYNPNGAGNYEDCVYRTFSSQGESGHKAACICGRIKNGAVLTAHTPAYSANADGVTHSYRCTDCGYISGVTEDHRYQNGVCTRCGFGCAHEDADKTVDSLTEGFCANCGKQVYEARLERDNGKVVEHYETVEEALARYTQVSDSIVTMLCDKDVGSGALVVTYEIAGKELDLNGHTLSGSGDAVFQINKRYGFTLHNGTVKNTGEGDAIQLIHGIDPSWGGTISDGELAVEALAVTAAKGWAIRVMDDASYADLYIKSGTFNGGLNAGTISGGHKVQIYGGTFIANPDTHSIYYPGSSLTETMLVGRLKDMLAGGWTYGDADGNPINYFAAENRTIVGKSKYNYPEGVYLNAKTVTIVEHASHTIDWDSGKCSICGAPCAHLQTDDDGLCTACGVRVMFCEAEGTLYKTIQAAQETLKDRTDNPTVKLLADYGDNVSLLGTENGYTLDLNGFRLISSPVIMLEGRTLTIADSSEAKTGGLTEMQISGGTAYLRDGVYAELAVSHGMIKVTGEGTVKITKKIEMPGKFIASGEYSNDLMVADMLLEGYAFYLVDENTGTETLVNGYRNVNGQLQQFLPGPNRDRLTLKDGQYYTVKPHTHSYASSAETTCECGKTCDHANVGADGVCAGCGTVFTAKVTDATGNTIYYADGFYPNTENTRSGLDVAFEAAPAGSTVTVLGGSSVTGYLDDGKTLVLDLNGKTVSNLYIGRKKGINALNVTGTGDIGSLYVHADNTAYLAGWSGTMGLLYVYGDGKVTLYAGTVVSFGESAGTAGSVLAAGRAFQNADGSFVEYGAALSTLANVTAAACSDHVVQNGHCIYCNKTVAAMVNGTAYDDLKSAVTAWLESGGKMTLYASADNIGAMDWTGGSGKTYTLDLNGCKLLDIDDDSGSTALSYQITVTNMDLTVQDTSAAADGQIDNLLLSENSALTLKSGWLGTPTVPKNDTVHVTLEGGGLKGYDIKVPLAYVLPDGGYLTNEEGQHVSLWGFGSSGNTVTVRRAPAGIGGEKQDTMPSGRNRLPFAPTAVLNGGADAPATITAAWYQRDGSPLANAKMKLSEASYAYDSASEEAGLGAYGGMAVGEKYDLFMVLTAMDGNGRELWQAAITGYELTVTLPTLDDAEIEFANGSEAVFDPVGSISVPEFTVSLYGETVDKAHYTVSDDTANGVGTYTVTVTGDGTNCVGSTSAEWTVRAYRLGGMELDPTATREYDGTTAVPDSLFTGRFQSGEAAGGTVALTAGDYRIAAASYNSADVGGGKTVTYTVELLNKNYVFENGGAAQTFTAAAADILKAGAPAANPVSLTVYNSQDKTYVIALPSLPSLPDGCKYGDTAYGAPVVAMTADGYYSDGALVKNGQLLLPILKNDVDTTGKIGEVRVTVTTANYDDITLTVNVVAANKIVPVADTVSATAITYGEALSASTLTGAMKDGVQGKFAWTDSLYKPVAGSYEAEWKFTPSGDDAYKYTATTGKVTVEVRKATMSVIVEQFLPMTYDGTPQVADINRYVDTADKAANPVFTYAAAESGPYTADVPAFTDAGSYTVYFLATDPNGNHEPASGTFTVTIDPKTVTDPIIALNGDLTYTGEAITPTVTVKDGETVIPAGEYTVSFSNNTNAGTAKVTIADVSGGNYIVSGGATFEITKAASSVTAAPTANALTYNGTEQELVTAGEALGGTMVYSLDGETYGSDIPTAVNAGEYTVWYKVEGDSNHNGTAPQSVSVTIGKAKVDVPAADASPFTYNGADQTYFIAENELYTVSGQVQKNAGSHTVAVALKDTANYVWSDGTAAAKEYTFRIDPKLVTITALDKRAYTGSTAPDLSAPVPGTDYTVEGLIGSDALVTGPTLAYDPATPDMHKAGTAARIVASNADAGGNYQFTYVDGVLILVNRANPVQPTEPALNPGETVNGSITVTPKHPSKGSTVTITVEPDEGYVLDGLTVTDKDGNELKLTNKGDGKYSFTMPDGKVAINASFKKQTETSPFVDVSTDAYYYEAVKWAAEASITGGIGGGLFGSDQPCTRAQIVTFLWRAAGSPEPRTMSSFTDVPADSYYVKAVAWAVENGVTTGTSATEFSPNATCTRAQSVTFLFRAAEASADGTPAFMDVAADAYYAAAVRWAADHGITNGIGNGLFGPDNACTRAQIVTFLWKLYAGK